MPTLNNPRARPTLLSIGTAFVSKKASIILLIYFETNERRWNTSCSREQKSSNTPSDLPKQYKNLLRTSRTMNAINVKSNTDILPNTPVLWAALLFTPNHTIPSALASTLSPLHLAIPRSWATASSPSFTNKNGVFNAAEGNFIYLGQLVSAHIVLAKC